MQAPPASAQHSVTPVHLLLDLRALDGVIISRQSRFRQQESRSGECANMTTQAPDDDGGTTGTRALHTSTHLASLASKLGRVAGP